VTRTSGCNANSAAPIGQDVLLEELRRLRVELLEYRIESETARVAALETSLGDIQAQRSRLAQQEQALAQQLGSPQTPAAFPNVTAEGRSQFESLRAAAIADESEKLRAEQRLLERREREVGDSLRTEQQRLQALQSQVNGLTAIH
jgi:chromosome segregation ATPase